MTTPEPWGTAPQQPGGNMQPYGPTPPPLHTASAGWYPNPQHGHTQWWDGYQWGQIAPPQPVAVPAAKSSGTAYLLLILLGGFAAHRFYLGRVGTAIVFLLMWWIGWATTGIGIGFFLVAACVIWWIVDLCIIPSMVREANTRAFIYPQLPPR